MKFSGDLLADVGTWALLMLGSIVFAAIIGGAQEATRRSKGLKSMACPACREVSVVPIDPKEPVTCKCGHVLTQAISYTCPHCDHPLNIPLQFAGATGKCNHCQGAITVPTP